MSNTAKPARTDAVRCPLLDKPVAKVCHTCDWFIEIKGVHPQTGEPVPSRWGCAIAWLPVLTIENSQQQRQTAAAVESARNEAVNTGAELAGAIATLAANLGPTPPFHREIGPGGEAVTLDATGRRLLNAPKG